MNEYKDLLLKSLSSKLQSYEEGQNNDNNRPPNMNQRFYSQNKDRDNNNINEILIFIILVIIMIIEIILIF